jgi:3-oxoadipate enol-lactonase
LQLRGYSDVAKHPFQEQFGGSEKVLIMVHGLGGSTNTWYPQAQVLKRDFRVVLYDLCGSARSPTADDISIGTHVEQLLEIVRTSGGGPVHLAGHSMGTIICQHLAVRYPELVMSLALLGAFPEPSEAARKALQGRGEKVRAEGMSSIADAIVAGGTSKDTRINNPSAAAFVRESIMAQSAEGYALNCEALAAAKGVDLGGLQCETLLITGDEDRTGPPDVGRAMTSAIRKSKLQMVSGCGHWASIERPKQVNYELTVFYSRLRQQSA